MGENPYPSIKDLQRHIEELCGVIHENKKVTDESKKLIRRLTIFLIAISGLIAIVVLSNLGYNQYHAAISLEGLQKEIENEQRFRTILVALQNETKILFEDRENSKVIVAQINQTLQNIYQGINDNRQLNLDQIVITKQLNKTEVESNRLNQITYDLIRQLIDSPHIADNNTK